MSSSTRAYSFLCRIGPLLIRRNLQQYNHLASGSPSFQYLSPAQLNESPVSARRPYSTLTAGEQKIYNAVQKGFPSANFIKVEDISGGCGAMFDVIIESAEFQGKKLIQQHMMVNKVLKSEIADMHGIRITTKASTS